MKKLALITLLSISISDVMAQNTSQKIVDEFFNLYEQKSSDEALDYLFGTNKWINESKDQIENIKFKVKSTIVNKMGEYYGKYLITSRTIGDDLILYSYLLKYDRQPIRFTFLFYSPDNKWRLQNFSFDDNIKQDLEEAAKAYRLKENFEY